MYTAHHVDWTKPSKGKIYLDGDIEILTAVYSVLKWQKHNGKIILHTDKPGYEAYGKAGLLDLWDDIETGMLEGFDFSDINYKSFWAAGKMAIASKIELPGFLLDLDMVVMGCLSETNFDENSDVAFHNIENIALAGIEEIYPAKQNLFVPAGYSFPQGLDWSVNSTTCNFYYLNNNELRDIYMKEAFDFMRKNPTNRMVQEIVFAEQRLFKMLVKKHGFKENLMLDKVRFHHMLGYWNLIDPRCPVDVTRDRFLIHLGSSIKEFYQEKREVFCRLLTKRIYMEFPEVFEKLSKIEVLRDYVGGSV